ncbi:MAG: PorV/PorQ family protein [Rhodothermia bacterium]|nr:MAG: PorV/PorQ family protein [Rhodothermia bacterium]
MSILRTISANISLIAILGYGVGYGVGSSISRGAMGQSAGAFSRIGFGARGIAMGNAVGADASGGTSPYYNPALATAIQRQNIDATVGLLSFDRSIQFLQLSSPLRQKAGVAVGLIHASVENIDGRDNSGFHTGDFSIDEYAGFLSFGIQFSDRVSAGIGLQFFRTDLFEGLDPAVAIGIDFGLLFRLSQDLHLSFVLDDLLARYQWSTNSINGSGGKKTTDQFPSRLRIGIMNQWLDQRLRLVGEIEARFRRVDVVSKRVSIFGGEPVERSDTDRLVLYESRLRAGMEYQLVKQFVVRAGLEQLGDEVFGGVRPSAGFMIEQTVGELDARFEYAFSVESPASGTMHLLTLRLFL